jgi:surface antigen
MFIRSLLCAGSNRIAWTGYMIGGGFRNARPFAFMLGLVSSLPIALGGCSLTMHIASLQTDPEATASISRPASPLDPSLDEEDWRRAQAALSLAVDPQGSGQPVNWDNPATRRKGSFAPAGNLVLVENTICRPFMATISQAGGAAREIRHQGQACRVGPGEWAMRQIQPGPTEVTATTRGLSGVTADRNQPLPQPTSTMLETSQSRQQNE